MQLPAKILVIDDGQDAHDMAELIFSTLGEPEPRPFLYHAWNGKQGLELVARHPDLDVIVLDLVMPDIDGFAVLEQLNKDRRFRSIPVCVYSGNRQDSTRALSLGARDFVHKPGDYLEIKLRLENLVRSKRRAEIADKAKVDFLAVVGHELRTPMNGIQGMTQVLKDGSLSDEQREYLSVLERCSHNLMSQINAVLEYLESENPLKTQARTPLSLRETIRAVVDRLAVEVVRHRVVVELQIADEIPDKLLGLPDKLQRVLFHLVDNAVKFSPEGKVIVGAMVQPSEGPDLWLELFIKDSGIGISPNERHRLFEPFTQAEGSLTRRFGGLGLGLSIASRVVSMWGGTLDVESQPNQGCTVRFAAPFSAVDHPL